MSHNFKRFIAASCAVVCAASLTGCSDSGYIGTVNGIQIPNGLYLFELELTAYNQASSKIKEDKGDSLGTAEVTVFTETIDGKSASQWLKDYALDRVKRYAAVETLFNEYGLTLSDEDIQSINDYVSSLDNDLGYYAQYYGIEESTFGEHYSNMGISKDSLRKLSENSYKESYVFLHNYDTDGLTPASADELNSYASENFAAVKLLKFEYTDYQGLTLKDDAEVQKIKDLAQAYADRVNSGEDWLDIQYDFDLRAAQLKAWEDADDSYAEEHSGTAEAASTAEADVSAAEPTVEADQTAEAGTSEASTAEVSTDEAATSEEETAADLFAKPVVNTGNADYDKYVQEKIDAATAEKKTSAEDCETFIRKDSSTLNEKVTEYIWNADIDNKATLFENEQENCTYVVVRDDITTMENWMTEQHETLLHGVKDDAFDEMLKSEYDGYSVELDDYLVNTKYAPEKLRGIGK